jgi:hypothetical protein
MPGVILDNRLIAGDLYLVKYGESYFSLRRHRSIACTHMPNVSIKISSFPMPDGLRLCLDGMEDKSQNGIVLATYARWLLVLSAGVVA